MISHRKADTDIAVITFQPDKGFPFAIGIYPALTAYINFPQKVTPAF